MTHGWAAEQFSQANPEGDGQDDVPALLRRVAESIAELGPVDVMDLVLHNDGPTEHGDRPSITVYFARLPADPAQK